MSRLRKRLPLLLLLAAGVWLWRGGGGIFPAGRELVWQLPDDRSIREVELQLWAGEQLLKRESRFFPSGPALEMVQKLSLREGDYQARVFIGREGAAASQVISRAVRVGDSEQVIIGLR